MIHTQDSHVNTRSIWGVNKDPIDVLRHKGKLYILDGHHRAVVAKYAEKPPKTLKANVLSTTTIKKAKKGI